ncbi:MAG TPA: hypothetical protein GXZ67_05925 [Clostridiaceae bacterium]|jgi:uncharacterized membrane protein|nr:hypothetical protein [Clostridiaceae bacterium]
MMKRDKDGFPFEYLSEKVVLTDGQEPVSIHVYDRRKSGGTLTQQIQILSLLALFLVLVFVLIIIATINIASKRQKTAPVQTSISIQSLQTVGD